MALGLGTTSDRQWYIHKTFVQVDEGREDGVGSGREDLRTAAVPGSQEPPKRRVCSEPPEPRCRSDPSYQAMSHPKNCTVAGDAGDVSSGC